ncbi:putative HNH endonuclease [Salmonella phage vB_SpuP_Spp16]|uniref:HNH endonuclease n=1 Tax=Salmonella phage vB_SpuP_Spp16 TaxID=2081603 RepID=A0A2P9JZR9_9CAUD|nr:putative HNH endonuclease [Salmonella phage vB_SpuP_Spp16]AVI05033.1 putative HNH endonuclease [Salmonella phage vB_SpuP_Spp16]
MIGVCIEHTQKGVSIGYATARFNGRYTTLHRKIWCIENNKTLKDIEGLEVRHLCNNPRCINKDHLAIGTPKDNAQDKRDAGVSFGSPNYGEDNGRCLLSDEQVISIRKEYVKGSRTHGIPSLAKKYGVGTSQIWRIVNCKQRN